MFILPKGVWKKKQSFLQFPMTCISKAKTREENRNLKNQGFDCWCRWKRSAKLILLIVQGRYLVQFFGAFVFVHTKKLTMKNFIKLFRKVEMQKSGNKKKLATVVFYLLCWTKNSIRLVRTKFWKAIGWKYLMNKNHCQNRSTSKLFFSCSKRDS